MLVLPPPGRSPSGCSASQPPLPPRSAWRRRNTALTAMIFPLLGEAGFSGWNLLPPCPGWVSLLPLCCRFCSRSRHFVPIFRSPPPIQQDFCSPSHDELFNQLVAHRVGFS